jgi:hypothetical protein
LGNSSLFSKSVRRSGCSQAETDVLAQDAVVLRYAAHSILKKRAQKNALFSGISVYVLAQLQVSLAAARWSAKGQANFGFLAFGFTKVHDLIS